jgi:para-aminobenzoate synthetase component I
MARREGADAVDPRRQAVDTVRFGAHLSCEPMSISSPVTRGAPSRGQLALSMPLPELAGLAPLDLAERLCGLPGMTLLESARPGRRARWSYLAADPLDMLESADDGPDPFVDARRLLARMDAAPGAGPLAMPFAGGLMGFLGYDLGRRLEHLPAFAAVDQWLPELRLGLYDQVIAVDHGSGQVWLASRAVDGDRDRLLARRDDVLARLHAPSNASPPRTVDPPGTFASNLDRAGYMAMVEAVRREIARGELYQANVARRLDAAFSADPWPVYRRLRTGDPVGYAAYVDVGPDPSSGVPRALLSASPEPFLSVSRAGTVLTDPIKGTRPRGHTREEDRALAAELLASPKDRAENTMIVDVLRNDLGRVCDPGSVRVPRLCRLERTGSVQHLVSTVTGRLSPGRDAFDLLAASFPGGSVTGAPKIRAMELIERVEPVRRGPYTGAALWMGPDGAMGSSILIRTLVADGARLTLHVGGGITWRSDAAAEWAETQAKAGGPLRALGAHEVDA